MSPSGALEAGNTAFNALLQEKLAIFRKLGAEQAAALRSYFSLREVAVGEDLWHEGEPGEYLAFVLSGCMQLKKDTEFGGKQVVIGVFSSGAVIGELSFSRNDVRVVTAAALENSQLAILTRSSFDELLISQPALGALLLDGVLQAACKRLEKSYERLASIF